MRHQFIIESDASDGCIGGVLRQKQGREEVTIRCASRVLNNHEKNYTTLEKEALAIIFSIKAFKMYLHDEFIVRTDHKPLTWLYNIKNPHGRIARWLMFFGD